MGFSPRDQIALDAHVVQAGVDGSGRISTFNLALSQARKLMGRDKTTGLLDPGVQAPPSLWGGTILYLVLLEQIGKTLRPLYGRPARGREQRLETAIRQFARGAATKKDRQALYGLRCAFAHEFGLVNQRPGPYQRVFRLHPSGLRRMVIPPQRTWNGKMTTASKSTATRVDLRQVADLVEKVVDGVRLSAQRGELRSRLKMADLKKQFSVVIEDEP